MAYEPGEEQGNSSKRSKDIQKSWHGDKTAEATGGTSHSAKEAEEQAVKNTQPGNGFGSFGEKSDADGSSSSALASAERGVSSDNAGGGFVSKVAGIAGKGSAKGKGFLKRNGPTITIIAMVLGGIFGYGSASFFGQMAMPISLLQQFKDDFGSMNIISQARTKRFVKWQSDVDSRKVKDCIKARIFRADKFKISPRQRQKLARAGITVDSDSFDYTVMRFTTSDGVEHIIVPDSRQAVDGKVQFAEAYEKIPEFKTAYSDGAKTWRGQVSDWFNSMADKFFSFFGVERSNWGNYKVSDDPKTNEANYKQKVAEVADSDGASGKAHDLGKTEDDVDEDTGEVNRGELYEEDDSLDLKQSDVPVDSNGKANTSELQKKLEAFSNSKLQKAASVAGMAANLTCAAFDVVGAINLIVIAYQTTQIIKVASTLFEGIDKAQVEDSNSTPIHEIGNSLTTPFTRTYELEDGETVTRTKSAMEANSIGALYGNIKGDAEDPSVKTFKLGSSLGKIGKAIGNSAASFKGCAYARLAAATIGVVGDVVEIAICIASVGIGCIISGIKDAIIAIGGSLAISGIIAGIIKFIVPFVANILTRKIATEVMGEDLGNSLVSGANIYMGQNHQYSGGSVASKSSLTKFITEKQEVLADKARVERLTKSPFDASSPYTFMGTLMKKMVPIITQVGSATSAVSAFNNIVGNSVRALTPSTHAIAAAITAQEAAEDTERNCDNIASIGGVADQFCNPYIISDLNTVDDDPAEIVNEVDDLGGFEDGSEDQDVPTIKKDSNLAKYILYCGQRQSPFGMADQNIANEVEVGSTGSAVGDSIIGAVPVVGDVVDIISNSSKLDNYGYIIGETCVTGNKVEGNAPTWSETKKYQRFIEDQNLAENMGLVEKSSVSAFLDEYYKEHPIDNSYEGVLARRSGLTKDEVVATLKVMEGLQFMAEYEPKDMDPYPAQEVEKTEIVLEEDIEDKLDMVGAIAVIVNNVHFDYVQRNYAA